MLGQFLNGRWIAHRVWHAVLLVGFGLSSGSGAVAAESAAESAGQPPMIPVGLDAYRQRDRWPYQRIGARAYMRSTYDRSGGNETADASHFLVQVAEDFNVTLDVEGTGVLYFKRTNHWHGSPWHYEVDGVDHIVQETTTADPTRKLDHAVFLPEHLFPHPLTWIYAQTHGADLMWVPIPFEQRLRLAYSRTFYGTGYYIYHLFFGSGTLHNRENVEYLVRALPVHIRFDNDRVHLACYFPMPFFRSARIELQGPNEASIDDVRWAVRTVPYAGPANHVGYFHATYRDHADPRPGHDLVFLDTRETEGGGDWSGSLPVL